MGVYLSGLDILFSYKKWGFIQAIYNLLCIVEQKTEPIKNFDSLAFCKSFLVNRFLSIIVR